MCDAHQRFISPPSSFKAMVAMKATRAARPCEAGMKVQVALKAALKAQPPTQPSLKHMQNTCMKFVKEFAHNSPKDLKAQVKVVRRRVRSVVGRERFHRQLHREAMLAAKQGKQERSQILRNKAIEVRQQILHFCEVLCCFCWRAGSQDLLPEQS